MDTQTEELLKLSYVRLAPFMVLLVAGTALYFSPSNSSTIKSSTLFEPWGLKSSPS